MLLTFRIRRVVDALGSWPGWSGTQHSAGGPLSRGVFFAETDEISGASAGGLRDKGCPSRANKAKV